MADLAAKTMREVGKASLHAAEQAGHEIFNTVTDTVEGLVGNVTDSVGNMLPGDMSAGGIEGSLDVDSASQAGQENTALQSGTSESWSTLSTDKPLWESSDADTGGFGEVNQVAGNSQVPGGLQNQHFASLDGPASGALDSSHDGIPDGVADNTLRPQMRIRTTERWDNVERTVYDNTDVMNVESSAADSFNPPSNRFGTPISDQHMVTGNLDGFSEPTVAQCGLPGGYDCNDGFDNFNGGTQTNWEDIRFATTQVLNSEGELVEMMDLSGLLDSGTLEDTPGTGVCDRAATRTCAQQRCRYRQCASNCTFSHCGEPYCNPPTMEVQRCGTVGDPPTYQCWMVTVCRPCNPCCSRKPGLLAQRCPMPYPDCSAFHGGCCLAEQPGGQVELELGRTGIDIPGVTCLQTDPGCSQNDCPGIGTCGPHRACIP